MKNANLNNTIKFIDKKAEYGDKKHNSKLEIKKLKSKKGIVIGYEEHRKHKAKKEKEKKVKNSKIYKSRRKIFTGFVCISSICVVFFLYTKFIKPSFTKTDENSFKTENQSLSKSEISTYSSIVKESIHSKLNINYKIGINEMHRNGNLIFTTGKFTVPEEGNVNFDMILKDYSPYSLKVNGKEYIK